jgi:hypothetical protein
MTTGNNNFRLQSFIRNQAQRTTRNINELRKFTQTVSEPALPNGPYPQLLQPPIPTSGGNVATAAPQRGRGRPKGSKNRKKCQSKTATPPSIAPNCSSKNPASFIFLSKAIPDQPESVEAIYLVARFTPPIHARARLVLRSSRQDARGMSLDGRGSVDVELIIHAYTRVHVSYDRVPVSPAVVTRHEPTAGAHLALSLQCTP